MMQQVWEGTYAYYLGEGEGPYAYFYLGALGTLHLNVSSVRSLPLLSSRLKIHVHF
jgi:hypothetical protein